MKTQKWARLVTKHEDGRNVTIGNDLVNEYGTSTSFSRRKEDGTYESAVAILYPSGHKEPLGKYNNRHVSTSDIEVLEHVLNTLKKSQETYIERFANDDI